jgi:hypothetical protein
VVVHDAQITGRASNDLVFPPAALSVAFALSVFKPWGPYPRGSEIDEPGLTGGQDRRTRTRAPNSTIAQLTCVRTVRGLTTSRERRRDAGLVWAPGGTTL